MVPKLRLCAICAVSKVHMNFHGIRLPKVDVQKLKLLVLLTKKLSPPYSLTKRLVTMNLKDQDRFQFF